MRRKDREVTKTEEILEIINLCKVFRVAMTDDEGLYIVPLNFGYEYDGTTYKFYFHSAKEGRKVNALKQNPNVAFEMDCGHKFVEQKDGTMTYRYQSVIGTGVMHLLTDMADKKYAMSLLIKHQAGRDVPQTDMDMDLVNMYKLEVTSLTGKANK